MTEDPRWAEVLAYARREADVLNLYSPDDELEAPDPDELEELRRCKEELFDQGVAPGILLAARVFVAAEEFNRKQTGGERMSNDSWYRACRLADAENRLEKLKEQKVPEQILEAGQRLLESAQRKVDADPVATRLLPQARRATFVEGAKRDMFRISGIGKLDELVEILLLQHPDYPEGSRAPDPINWDSSIELFREGVLKGDSLMILMGLNGILSEIKYEETSL